MRSRKQERTAISYGTHFKRETNKVKLKRIFLVSYTENVSRYFGACSEDKINAIIPNSYGSPSNEAVACWKPTRKSSTSPIEARRRWLKKLIVQVKQPLFRRFPINLNSLPKYSYHQRKKTTLTENNKAVLPGKHEWAETEETITRLPPAKG